MSLIKSISGIRGTIGGFTSENLTPVDIVKFTAAYAQIVLENKTNPTIIIGRDGRISGQMVQELVMQTLSAMGIHVIDLGLTTTPTVEYAVINEKADGGIIITASHNPKEWNALKLLNSEGEFISAEWGNKLIALAENEKFLFAPVDQLGVITTNSTYLQKHIDAIVNYPLINQPAIASKNFKIVVDVINSTGSIYVPALLNKLGINDIIILNNDITGRFSHNPEPLPEHLTSLSNEVVKQKADLGIAVDPDVDRLCFINEDGSFFGEEYTLVAIADYVLNKRKGNTVSNMSSTKSLKEITLKHGGEYYPSAVGEVNVVKKMKEVFAVIGGEGNGGIIVPDFHYGRDALIGIALFLSFLAEESQTISTLRNRYPFYYISKNKIELDPKTNVANIFDKICSKYKKYPINTEDGLKIEFDEDWVHLRTSNTEPIIRIYSESNFETKANNIALQLMRDIKEFSS